MRSWWAAVLMIWALRADAQSAVPTAGHQVFDAVSRSVFSVHVFEDSGQGRRRQVSAGSAVAYAYGRVVTNCHVLAPGIRTDGGRHSLVVELKEAGQRSGRSARLVSADPARDLCVLEAVGLEVLPVLLGTTRALRVGQAVYAVGSPRGLELTLSGGLISGLRKTGAEPVIQTDAAVSPGSSGGGLFDDRGRLIGITTFNVVGGQNLNFALPVEWIKDVASRGISPGDFAAIVAHARRLAQGGAGAKGSVPGGGRWVMMANHPGGYDVYLDAGRLQREGAEAQAWVLHNFHVPVLAGEAGAYRSRVLLAQFDCTGARWSLRHAATYTEPFAGGRRLSADDFNPHEADYRAASPGSPMDAVRAAACR